MLKLRLSFWAYIFLSFQIREDAAFTYVDATDENKSNWMRWALTDSFRLFQNLFYFIKFVLF